MLILKRIRLYTRIFNTPRAYLLAFSTAVFAITLNACVPDPSIRLNQTPPLSPQEIAAAQQAELKAQAAAIAAAEDAKELELFNIKPGDYSEPAMPDVWTRVRNGFNIDDNLDNARLLAELHWYTKHPEYMNRVIKRATPFLHYVINETEKRNLPTELVLLPIVESAYQTFAYSHGRASGIWQFIPSTGKMYGLKQNWWYDGRRDVYAATQAALTYLENLGKEFNGNWLHALAAYNSGSGTVRRAIRKNKKRGKPTDFWSLDLPKETRAYVPKLLALKRLVNRPELYNLSLNCVEDIPYFESIDTGSQIDLAMAAEMAEIELDTLYGLNPAFNHWATPPYGPHRLLIPVDSVETFKKNLAQLPKSERVKWKRHKIKQGQTLGHIAERYSVSVTSLKQINNLRSHTIRAGKYLVIPVSSRKLSDYNLTAYQRKKTLQNIRRKGHKITHTVQSGDTFWDLSRKYKVKSHSIARWNSMAIKDPLRAGQKLVIWTKSSAKPSHKAVAQARASRDDAIQRISYKVRNGDSLYLISQKFNVAIGDLKRWNRFTSKYLQPGQIIKLYVDVTRQAGER
ncbi:Membrane-bound lytic murein transglycosylase D [hydrothermal vent metagenome]|uniref:Membrane-bound lytic murein transglycosylase D n=1 Tax=hydrothermal vent metagenome TaxID=652676 RepID=A0A3B0YBV4_9ZZZZ